MQHQHVIPVDGPNSYPDTEDLPGSRRKADPPDLLKGDDPVTPRRRLSLHTDVPQECQGRSRRGLRGRYAVVLKW